jgi:hypothetical protein
MVSAQELKRNLYIYLSAYSKQLVLYDESGTRVMDPDKQFIKIWLQDLKIFVRISEDNEDTTLIVSVVGKRKIASIRTFLDNLREFANTNNVLMNLELVDDGSTPSKIDNPIKESWHDVDLSKWKKTFTGFRVAKAQPMAMPTAKDNILVPIHTGYSSYGDGDNIPQTIAQTNQTLFGMLTDTTQALANLAEKFTKTNILRKKTTQ